MNALVAIALFGWIPLSIAAFAIFTPRIATMLTVVGGWLFLPVASYDLPGLPAYTKSVAVAIGTLSGLMLFGRRQFAGLRLGFLDVPTLAWCLVPGASSLANGHGAYDAVSVVLQRIVAWGIPYLVGRAVFRDFAAIHQLARGLFLGGLVYVPLCLYEMRMSPQLHAMLYGFQQHEFIQCIRQEGYRPMVFMDHGLMVGMWMTIATIAGFSLWRHGGFRLAKVPGEPLLLVLLATTVLCKSMGALVLLGTGVATLAAVWWLRSRLPIYVLIVLPPCFVAARLGLDWGASGLIEFVRQYAPERASSLEFRIVCEQIFLSEVWRHPWLGASAWEVRAAVADPELSNAALDSAWIITLISHGLVGLVLFFAAHFVPIVTLLRRMSVRELARQRTAAATALAVGLCLFVGDCLFNAMFNSVYILVLGGVASLAAGTPARRAQPKMQAVPQRRAGHRVVHCLS